MADQFSFDISGRKRGKIKTLSLDEQIEDFLDARGGLRLADADFNRSAMLAAECGGRFSLFLFC